MRRLAGLAAALSLLVVPPVGAQEEVPPQEPPPAPPAEPAPAPVPDPARGSMSLRVVSGLEQGRVRYVARGNRVAVRGTVRPFVAGQRVAVEVRRAGRTVGRDTLEIRKAADGSGHFQIVFRPRRSGTHTVHVSHAATAAQEAFSTRPASVRAVRWSAGAGSSGVKVSVLHRGLRRLGYVTSGGSRFDAGTARSVTAFRKVNRMARNGYASQKVFRMLLDGRGGFKLRYPNHGKHVEADLSRQVLVLARGGKVERVYHTSSGTPSTPTVLGSFRFYRKDLGTNGVGMVHSSYFIRGYAIHGYKSVPNHPASHGCLRVPIPNALAIFRWVNVGDRIDVYR